MRACYRVRPRARIVSASRLHRRCDIYSYGVLVWELYHASVPYSDFPMDQVIVPARTAWGMYGASAGWRAARAALQGTLTSNGSLGNLKARVSEDRHSAVAQRTATTRSRPVIGSGSSPCLADTRCVP